MTALTLTGGAMDEAEAAAALAAVTCLLEEEAAALAGPAPSAPDGWHGSARLITQGLAPARVPGAPRWGNIERLRRAGRAGTGIIGQ